MSRPILSLTLAASAVAFPLAAHAQADADHAFSGPRIGAVAGYDNTDVAPGAGAADGFVYGGQIGYDYDFGRFVTGAESDFSGTTTSGRAGTATSEAAHYFTLAARAGVKPLPQVLLFARGGLAEARVRLLPGGAIDNTGYTVGGGAELALFGHAYLRAEYRYSDYGERLRGQQVLAGAGWRF